MGGVLACKKYADRGATAVVPGVALPVHGWVAEWVPRKTQGGEKQTKEDGEEGTEGGGGGKGLLSRPNLDRTTQSETGQGGGRKGEEWWIVFGELATL